MQNTPRKSIWWRSRQKTSLCRQYKRGFKKKAKLAFLQRGQSKILVKKLKFFYLLSLSKQIEKNCLLTFQIKKRALKTIKTTVYEKRKIRIFPKLLVHRFGQKFEIFSTLVFMQNRRRKRIWEHSSQKKVCIILCNPPITPCHSLSPLVTPCNPL